MRTMVGTYDSEGDAHVIDLFVQPTRNPAQPEGPLTWIGEANFPIGFRVGANSLPELLSIAEVHGRQVLAGDAVKVRLFLVPDKVPPEPVVEVHLDLTDSADRGPNPP